MTYSVLYEIRIVLWVLLILFLGTTGYCIYGITEDDKNLGYYIGGLLTSIVLVCVIIYLIIKGNQEQANIIKEKNRLELLEEGSEKKWIKKRSQLRNTILELIKNQDMDEFGITEEINSLKIRYNESDYSLCELLQDIFNDNIFNEEIKNKIIKIVKVRCSRFNFGRGKVRVDRNYPEPRATPSVPEPRATPSVPEPRATPSVPEPRATPSVPEPSVIEPTPEIFTPEIKAEAERMLKSTENEEFDIEDYDSSIDTYKLKAFYLELCYRFNLLGYKFPNYKLQIHMCKDENKFEETKRIFDSRDVKTFFEKLNIPQLDEPSGKPAGEWFSDFYTAEYKDGYSDNWISFMINESWHVDPRFCQCMVVSRFNNDTTFTLTPENVPTFKRYLTESDLGTLFYWDRFVKQTGYSGIQIPNLDVGNIKTRTVTGERENFFYSNIYDVSSYVAWNRKAFEEVIIFKRETYQDLLDKYFPQ